MSNLTALLKDFHKKLDKISSVSVGIKEPRKWYSTGNYALNKIISGSYFKGIPESRVSVLVGPSGAGKSFILCNALKNMQEQGAFVVCMDSENALDLQYLKRIGVDLSPDRFDPIAVNGFSDVVAVVSEFVSMYDKQFGKWNDDAPAIVFALDSIGMLMTDGETKHFESGEQRGDQGQHAKQTKQMLKTIVQAIKPYNITFMATSHVYAADPLKGEGMFSVTPALRYSASQITLVTALQLKEDGVRTGVRMKAQSFKSRFSKPGTNIEMEIPYDRGMSPITGLYELLKEQGVVETSGAWAKVELANGVIESFQSSKFTEEFALRVLKENPKIRENERLFDDSNEDLISDEVTDVNSNPAE